MASAGMRPDSIIANDRNLWTFSPFSMGLGELHEVATSTLLDGVGMIVVDAETIHEFLVSCHAGYLPNPYHNYMHAVDVCGTTFLIASRTGITQLLSDVEFFSILVAAVAHDISHPGLNNQFLVETRDKLALLYNDRSPLENMHCCKLYWLMRKPDRDVFGCLTPSQTRQSRKIVVEAILHTDVAAHNELVRNLQDLISDVPECTSRTCEGKLRRGSFDGLRTPDRKTVFLRSLVHWAITTSPAKPWKTAEVWADLALEECFRQGDKERELGIPVQRLCDRNLVRRSFAQMDLVEVSVAPFLKLQLQLFTELGEVAENCLHNFEIWKADALTDHRRSSRERDELNIRSQNLTKSLRPQLVGSEVQVPKKTSITQFFSI